MASDWYHRSDPEWLKARCNYITASDMASLWPETATGKKRTITEDDYLVALFKSREFNPSAIHSAGPAGRGHILEPYAVDEFNLQWAEGWPPLIYHWDNCVVHNGGIIACSPDALSAPQPEGGEVLLHLTDIGKTVYEVDEIKSYGADKHFATYKMGQAAVERIQISTQMYVFDDAERGRLLLYNPRLEKAALLVTTWNRCELSHELEIIDDIAARLCLVAEKLQGLELPLRKGPSEEEILQQRRDLDTIY